MTRPSCLAYVLAKCFARRICAGPEGSREVEGGGSATILTRSTPLAVHDVGSSVRLFPRSSWLKACLKGHPTCRVSSQVPAPVCNNSSHEVSEHQIGELRRQVLVSTFIAELASASSSPMLRAPKSTRRAASHGACSTSAGWMCFRARSRLLQR